ncbi:META domain-containing protein [Roseovarius sp. D0-M9]|uniref:META domain-containing protein n=1 Tax=Roseovarius sp. D0-M9 TaxID=3127117 RepID=UPI0030100D4C
MRPFSLSVALTLGVAATAYAQGDTRQVSGHLIYLPRIALPEDAEVTIVAQGAFDAEFDQLRYQTEGQQVPLPFVLDVPRDLSGTISALIRVADEPMWLVRDIGFEAGGEPVDLGDLQFESYTALAFASRFDCGGTEVQFGVVDDDAVLRVHDVDYKMVEAVAASGARYVNEDDDSTEFWSKGNSAMVTVMGEELPECTQIDDTAASYRASGNEPGWNVNITETQVEVVADYGAVTRTAPRPDVQVTAGAYVFDMPAIDSRLTLEEKMCRDDATGMPHPHSATLQLDDRSFSGCGGDPASLLTGAAWQIEDVAGLGVVDDSTITIQFHENGRISGSTGCNRFMSGYDLTGEGLTLGQMGVTMMACPEALMTQERRVLDALGEVQRFDVDDTGTLRLMGGPEGNAVLTANRP